MDLSKILTISGRPGLFQLISQTKNGALVESLVDGKRIPAFATDRISSLEEISILCTDEDTPLKKVFEIIFTTKPEGVDVKKLSDSDIKKLFKEIIPSYDIDKVYTSDMKKVFSWYNLLSSKGLISLPAEEELKEETVKGETV